MKVSSKDLEVRMTFHQALDAIMAGHDVTRASWPDPANRCSMRRGVLMIHTKKDGEDDAEWHTWILCEADLLAKDWMFWVPAFAAECAA